MSRKTPIYGFPLFDPTGADANTTGQEYFNALTADNPNGFTHRAESELNNLNVIKANVHAKSTSAWNADHTTVIRAGEFGIDISRGVIRLGDGVSKWSELSDYPCATPILFGDEPPTYDTVGSVGQLFLYGNADVQRLYICRGIEANPHIYAWEALVYERDLLAALDRIDLVEANAQASVGEAQEMARQAQMSADNAQVAADTAQARADEAFTFASDGKAAVAGVIGEPALETDTFAQLAGYIHDSKEILAFNLTDKGVDADINDALLILAEKVADIPLFEGEIVALAGANDLLLLTENIKVLSTLSPYIHDKIAISDRANVLAVSGGTISGIDVQLKLTDVAKVISTLSPYIQEKMGIADCTDVIPVSGDMIAGVDVQLKITDATQVISTLSPYVHDNMRFTDHAKVIAVSGETISGANDQLMLTDVAELISTLSPFVFDKMTLTDRASAFVISGDKIADVTELLLLTDTAEPISAVKS